MLIVSWNIAGLKPALQKIHNDNYPNCSNSNNNNDAKEVSPDTNATPNQQPRPPPTLKNNKPSTTTHTNFFANYLTHHNSPSILCLQEHKIPHAQLSSRSEPHQCSTLPGYESFWSCATHQKCKGFNGVVTYAKIGLVKRADCNILGDFGGQDLDGQGRCVMTDHGDWVLFNVYVPCVLSVEKMREKMIFLKALRAAMKRERDGSDSTSGGGGGTIKKGKHVILVGDLNLKHCVKDVYWKNRVLNVDHVLERMQVERNNANIQQQECNSNGQVLGERCNLDFPKWKVDLENNWGTIVSALETIEAIPRKTTNPSTNESFDKFRARVTLSNNTTVMLGSCEDTPEDAIDYYSLNEETLVATTDSETNDTTADNTNTNTTILCKKKNVIDIGTLTELMSKIANVVWDEKTQREIAETEGGLNPDSPPYLWMKSVLEEDGMVDTFRHFYPDAEGRFTCWNQFTNKRYTNEGGRIDFMLVDEPLLKFVQKGDGETLRCGGISHDNPLGEEAALIAATANGMFECGSFAGGGIAAATKRALDTQFGHSHTGMIYTPPSYSDHIATSLLMSKEFKDSMGQLSLDEKDSRTRKTQPHKKQRSIASFLAPKVVSQSTASSSSIGKKRKLAQAKNSIKTYFNGTQKSSSEKAIAPASKAIPAAAKRKNSILNHFKKEI